MPQVNTRFIKNDVFMAIKGYKSLLKSAVSKIISSPILNWQINNVPPIIPDVELGMAFI